MVYKYPYMKIDLKNRLLRACRHLLKPVVRLLLHSGVTYREFAELSKLAFVDVAGNEFGLQGRKTNASRVAILTGIGRKEVSRLRKVIADEDGGFVECMSPVTRVTAAWHQNPDYCDANGRPRLLKKKEFESLVTAHAGDVPAVALAKELQRLGVVKKTSSGFTIEKRTYVPGRLNDESVRMLGAHLNDMGSTIAHNLLRGEENPHRLQRVVSNEAIPARALNRFRRLAADQGQALLESLDDWLEAHQSSTESADGPLYRTGVGIYFFEDKVT